jgi:ParB-like chromosome segregation protein Spo0J
LKISVNAVRTGKHFNPRAAVDSHEVAALSASMRTKIGQVAPIILRQGDNELIDGLHRLQAAKRAGQHDLEAVTIRAEDPEAREMALACNSLTSRLSWLERGRAVCEILDQIRWHHGRERKKRELAKQLGMSHHRLEADVSAYRLLSPEAWQICLKLSKQHLLSQAQVSRIWQFDHTQQLAVLRRIERMKNPVEIDQHLKAFLASRQVQRNLRGRPRGSTKVAQSKPTEQPITPAVAKEHNENPVKAEKRERVREKVEEALRMDTIDLTTLQTWRLIVALDRRLRKFTELSCDRWRIVEALRKDLQVLEPKEEARM